MTDSPFERLKLLYDYEKFHIGLYGAMMTGFITILSLWSKTLTFWMVLALSLAILSLLIAAFCGAILASSVIDIYGNYKFWKSGTDPEAVLNNFWETEIGPYEKQWWKAEKLWRVGHSAFWIAVILVVVTFLAHVVYWTMSGELRPC